MGESEREDATLESEQAADKRTAQGGEYLSVLDTRPSPGEGLDHETPERDGPTTHTFVAAASTLLAEGRDLGRRALTVILAAGDKLTAAKTGCTHGDWLPLLPTHKIKPRTAHEAMALSARRDQIRERRAFEDLTPAGARRLLKAVDDPLTYEATEARLAAREADGVPAWMHGNAREQQRGAVADGLGPDDVARLWATLRRHLR